MTGYECPICGALHDERPNCFIVTLPEAVLQIPKEERVGRVEASSDQCILDDEHYFILGNLDVRVRGSDEFIRWSVWSTLSEANFSRASELWEAKGRESEPPYFGWLSNQIPGYPYSVNIRALVHTQPVGVRPMIEVTDAEHPLAGDQREGISAQRFDELVHAAWHSDSDETGTAG